MKQYYHKITVNSSGKDSIESESKIKKYLIVSIIDIIFIILPFILIKIFSIKEKQEYALLVSISIAISISLIINIAYNYFSIKKHYRAIKNNSELTIYLFDIDIIRHCKIDSIKVFSSYLNELLYIDKYGIIIAEDYYGGRLKIKENFNYWLSNNKNRNYNEIKRYIMSENYAISIENFELEEKTNKNEIQ